MIVHGKLAIQLLINERNLMVGLFNKKCIKYFFGAYEFKEVSSILKYVVRFRNMA